MGGCYPILRKVYPKKGKNKKQKEGKELSFKQINEWHWISTTLLNLFQWAIKRQEI